MYFDYLKEKNPGVYFEICEKDRGFAQYSFMTLPGDIKAVWIEEIYVRPEFRKTNLATSLSEKVQKLAKENFECVVLLGTISPTNSNSQASLEVLLAHGMKILKAEQDLIWFFKEL